MAALIPNNAWNCIYTSPNNVLEIQSNPKSHLHQVHSVPHKNSEDFPKPQRGKRLFQANSVVGRGKTSSPLTLLTENHCWRSWMQPLQNPRKKFNARGTPMQKTTAWRCFIIRCQIWGGAYPWWYLVTMSLKRNSMNSILQIKKFWDATEGDYVLTEFETKKKRNSTTLGRCSATKNNQRIMRSGFSSLAKRWWESLWCHRSLK